MQKMLIIGLAVSALSGCANTPAEVKSFQPKATFNYTDAIEKTSECILQQLDNRTSALIATARKTESGIDVQWRTANGVVLILSLENASSGSTGTLFVTNGALGPEAWVKAIEESSAPCGGKKNA